jgi:8-oxo-dGTP pyrophosphatase MutT (NUDIX family)
MGERCLVDLRCSVLLLRAGSLLLCQRSSSVAFWTLPGGSPRADESTTAAVREVYEETGLKVTVDRVFMTLETINLPDAPYRRLEVIFEGSERDYTAAPRQLEGGSAPALVPIEQLEGKDLRPPISREIQAFVDPRSGPAWANQWTVPWMSTPWLADEF